MSRIAEVPLRRNYEGQKEPLDRRSLSDCGTNAGKFLYSQEDDVFIARLPALAILVIGKPHPKLHTRH